MKLPKEIWEIILGYTRDLYTINPRFLCRVCKDWRDLWKKLFPYTVSEIYILINRYDITNLEIVLQNLRHPLRIGKVDMMLHKSWTDLADQVNQVDMILFKPVENPNINLIHIARTIELLKNYRQGIQYQKSKTKRRENKRRKRNNRIKYRWGMRALQKRLLMIKIEDNRRAIVVNCRSVNELKNNYETIIFSEKNRTLGFIATIIANREEVEKMKRDMNIIKHQYEEYKTFYLQFVQLAKRTLSYS